MKRISFSIGLTNAEGHVIPPPIVAQKKGITQHELATKFGGYSTYSVHGGWIDPSGKEFTEPAVVYYCLLDSSKLPEVRPTAAWLAELWDQQAVMVTTEPVESMEYVTAERKAA